MSLQGHDRPLPVFVVGMLQRTGTNHLWDLFGLHPDTELLSPVFEDHLLQWSPHLTAYVDDVKRSWSEDWAVPAAESDALLRSLGDGIIGWLAQRSDKTVVTKMPSVEQAENFFGLFDDCPLVIIVRDGRSVAESMARTFDMSHERAIRRWARAADVVLSIRDRYGDRPNVAIVRFEDIVADPSSSMRRLLGVAGLDPERYPYRDLDDVPVRGSSTLRSEQGGDVHWAPVDKRPDFDPLNRSQHWEPALAARFEQIAGSQQVALGYELPVADGSVGVTDRLSWIPGYLEYRYLDLRVRLGRARRSVGRVHGRI